MVKIICLVNSYKGGGERCLAGIDPDTGNWIRPVSGRNSGAITAAMRLIDGREPQILDILEIPLEDSGPDEGCQPENRLLKPGKWKKVGRITPKDLMKYCEDDSVILQNHQEYVLPEFFDKLPKSKWRSLQLVHNPKVSFNSAYKPNQWRVVFRDGKGHTLDLKLTDPLISDRLRNNEKVNNNCILTVSLATPWSPQGSNQPERCYKMVAGVVELSLWKIPPSIEQKSAHARSGGLVLQSPTLQSYPSSAVALLRRVDADGARNCLVQVIKSFIAGTKSKKGSGAFSWLAAGLKCGS